MHKTIALHRLVVLTCSCPFAQLPALQEQRDLTTKIEGSYGEQDVFAPLVDQCFKAQVRGAWWRLLRCNCLGGLGQQAPGRRVLEGAGADVRSFRVLC